MHENEIRHNFLRIHLNYFRIILFIQNEGNIFIQVNLLLLLVKIKYREVKAYYEINEK